MPAGGSLPSEPPPSTAPPRQSAIAVDMGRRGNEAETSQGLNDDDDDLADLMTRAASISKAPAPTGRRSGPGEASARDKAQSDSDEGSEVDVTPFIDAAEDYLRGAHSGRTKPAAYVVYNGRIPGEAQAAWNLALRQRTVGPPGSSAAHISSMQPSSAQRAPRTPASAARLAGIREGLAQQSPTPPPRHHASPSPAPPATLVRGPVAAAPPIEPGCMSSHPIAPRTAATSSQGASKLSRLPTSRSNVLLQSLATRRWIPHQDLCRHHPEVQSFYDTPSHYSFMLVWSYLPEDLRCSQPVPEVINGVPFLSDENAWYAVVEGRRPGVYHGRTAASRALGRQSQGCVRMAATEDEANGLFPGVFLGVEVLVGAKAVLRVSKEAPGAVLSERSATLVFADGNVQVRQRGGGNEDEGPRGKLDDQAEFWKDYMATPGGIERAEGLYGAQADGDVHDVAMGLGKDVGAKVEGRGGVDAPWKDTAEILVVLKKGFQVVAVFFVHVGSPQIKGSCGIGSENEIDMLRQSNDVLVGKKALEHGRVRSRLYVGGTKGARPHGDADVDGREVAALVVGFTIVEVLLTRFLLDGIVSPHAGRSVAGAIRLANEHGKDATLLALKGDAGSACGRQRRQGPRA
ncbi:hypothetical protein H0H92_000722 [Tricholoma furcatifolium]|nr:hypothetical protein H0H92_000722 [Tricholoma furcatifolium]